MITQDHYHAQFTDYNLRLGGVVVMLQVIQARNWQSQDLNPRLRLNIGNLLINYSASTDQGKAYESLSSNACL